jgi:hypothetical protein
MPVQDNRIVLIAEAIQCYLRDHPKAADTIEGIAGWWVAYERYQQTQEEVQQALDYLVAKGAVIRNESRNGRIVYSGKEQQRFF